MFGFLLPVPLIGGVGARAALVVLILYGAAADRADDDRRASRASTRRFAKPAWRWG